jgi:hypothetical protein
MTKANQASKAALMSNIRVPDIAPANEITEFVRDTESPLPQRFLLVLGLLFAAFS